jgi:hypothetical protein
MYKLAEVVRKSRKKQWGILPSKNLYHNIMDHNPAY